MSDKNQYLIDFEGPAQERLMLLDAIGWERTGLTQHAWGSVRTLLKQIVLCGWRDGCHAYAATLAARCEWSRAKLFRIAAVARERGLLATDARHNRAGRTSSEWQIDWSAVASLGTQNVRLTGRKVRLTPSQDETHPYKDKYKHQFQTQSSPTAVQVDECSADAGWSGVGVVLFEDCGVQRHDLALAHLRSQGATPDDALALAAAFLRLRDRWLDDARRPVILYRRCLAWRPGQDAELHWPPANDPAWERQQSHERRVREEALQAAARERRRREREAMAHEPAFDVLGEFKRLEAEKGVRR